MGSGPTTEPQGALHSVAILTTTVAVLLAACSDTFTQQPPPETVTTTVAPTTTTSGSNGQSSPVISTTTQPAEGGAAEVSDDFQRAILDDGYVTDAEWESALLALIACMEDQGVQTLEYDSRFTGWNIAYAEAVPGSGVDTEAVYGGCYAQYVDDVETQVFAQNELSPSESEALRLAMVECLRAAGVDLKDAADDIAMIDAAEDHLDLYGDCRDETMQQLFP